MDGTQTGPGDFDPDHPDRQHEQPPLETTDNPDDFGDPGPEAGTADPGELPDDIGDAPENMPGNVAAGDEPDGDDGD